MLILTSDSKCILNAKEIDMPKATCNIGDITLEVKMNTVEANAFGTFLDKFNKDEVTKFCNAYCGKTETSVNTFTGADIEKIDAILSVMFKAMKEGV
jgi:hypothetical protein